MEGVSGPSELELNKERISVLKQKHQRLCYAIKKKEQVHSNNNLKLHQQIKQQWTKIEELKKQKSELTLQLRLHDTQSFTKPGNKNLEKFLKSLDDLMKLEEQIKAQTDELNKCNLEIREVDQKIRQKRKQLIQSYRNRDRVIKFQKNISFLQNRLNGSLTKYNQLLIANNALREDISSILQTQSTFRKQYSHLKQLISMGKKTISEIVNAATTSYQTGESAKFKLNLLKHRSQVDQRKMEEKIKDLQLLIEQDKQLKAFIEFKAKDRGTLSEREIIESTKDQVMEDKLQEYQALLARIETAAGCKNINKICKLYTQQEELSAILFGKVNNLNVEIEKLQDEVAAEEVDLDITSQQFKEQKRKDLAERTNIDTLTEEYRLEAQDLEDAADAKAEELEEVKKGVQNIYQHLAYVSNQDVTFTVDENITDDNILLYLEALEKRVLELIECQLFLDKKKPVHVKDDKQIISKIRKADQLTPLHKSKFTITMKNEDHVPETCFSYNTLSLEEFAKSYLVDSCSNEKNI